MFPCYVARRDGTNKSVSRHIDFVFYTLKFSPSLSLEFLKKFVSILNSIQRHFLWDAKGEDKKVFRVRWEVVCSPKEKVSWVSKILVCLIECWWVSDCEGL